MTIISSPRTVAPTSPAQAFTAPVARTSGHTAAPTLYARRIAVAWELDTTTGAVTVNGEYAGRVIEIVAGLFQFETPADTARGVGWGSFGAADAAAEAGAVRSVLILHNCP